MARSRSQICSTWGQKYKLDRSIWTTYANFVDIYKYNLEMVNAGVVDILISPEWQDKEAKLFDESLVFGYEDTHKLKHQDYCVVIDEVGVNINIKGGSYIRGEMYLTEVGVIDQ